MKRLLTVVLSVVLFASIYSWFSYVPSSQREPNVYYFGFFETFMFVVIYAGPVYFLVGLPLSIYIDNLIAKTNSNSNWARYFVGLGLYSFTGTLVGIIVLLIFSQSMDVYQLDVISFSIYGLIASNFYYHLSLLILKINNN